MNAHEDFLDTFKYATSNRKSSILAQHLEHNWKLLTIVSAEHYESIVCGIFDRRDGLLCFLDYELENRSSDKNTDDALKQGFAFLEFFIKNFHKTSCFVQYIYEIKNVCMLGLTKKTTQYILKNACKAFKVLVELFGNHENLKLTEIAEQFACNSYKYEPKERRWIFFVLSKIIKHKRNICLSLKCSKIIFQQLYCDAFQKHQLRDTPHGASSLMEFHMYFDILTDILDIIQPPDTIRQRLFLTSYKWIKFLSQRDNQQHGKKTKESGIRLLSRHVESFQEFLYSDYKHWYDVLRRLSREGSSVGRYALKIFYRVIGRILTDRNTAQNKSILLYFQQEFQTVLKDTNLDSTTLQLTIYGFSQMAAPCNTYLGENSVREIYSMITTWALPLCSNEQSDAEDVEKVCYYQEELSAILYQISDVTVEKINVLAILSIYTIKRFPEVNNVIVISSLIKIICNLGTINKSLLQRYLDDIIFGGIIWSCSHTLAVDVELQQELNNLQPICYKNYLPLWTELLKAEKYPAGREQMVRLVAETLMNECIASISRLDLRVKQTEENTVLSDVALTQSAVNQTDFRVFTNIVDLYVDIIDKSELSLFTNVVHRYLCEIVRFSHKYPLISGFYKLARVGMKIFVTYMSEEEEKIREEEEKNEKRNEETSQTQELLSNYVIHTLDMIPAFSKELLIACLYLILHAPLTYVENVLPRTLPMFKIAFTIGLSNLELAYTALIALKTWTIATDEAIATMQKRERNERTSELLRELVPYLEPYLRSTESSVDISQDLTVIMTERHVKRVDAIDTEWTLRNFQRQVLLFLGSLSHDLLSDFAYDRASRNIGVSWDHKDLLEYIVPLPNETRPKVYFDRILPKIMTLARDSSDRRTKIAACEVLHSLVALVAGTAKQTSNDEKYLAVYGTLCPIVLALGCDGDEVVRNLYHPLTLQLMHWMSSVPKLTNSVIEYLLDSLTDNSNPALREFAGMCLAEFTSWSMRQEPSAQTRSNVRKIIQKINNLALHPSAHKRIAAAVAFNHLYKILREDDEIVSTYWLEIFYCFVRSSDGCDDSSITNALARIEKVIRIKADLLNADDDLDRQKPPEFDKAVLIHALYWLLSQCGVLDERCRTKCMELYVNVSRYIGNSARETTQTYIDTYGKDRLYDIVLKDLTSCTKDISVADNVTSLLKTLDYYVWLTEKRLLPIETLFPASEDTIFSCIRSFAQQFLRTIREPSTVTLATKSREFELRTLQCKALMTTFNFLQVLLNVHANILPESVWTEPLSELIVRCVMCPRKVGFDVKNIEMTDRLPRVLETLLNSMKLRLDSLPNNFARCLRFSQESLVTEFRKLHEIAQNSSDIELTQKINGLILLKRCDMLLEMSDLSEGDDTITRVFNFLVSNRFGKLTCKDLSTSMIEYLQVWMEFRLSLITKSADVQLMIETLVKRISDDTPIISVDSAKITHGDYFLDKFKSVIFKYMLTHRDVIASIFEKVSRNNPAFLLKWIEDLVLFLKRHRRELQAHVVDETVDTILRQFTCLERAVNNIDSRSERLTNIYGTAVRLKPKPTEITQVSRELYQWILDQLTRNDSFEYKMLILRNFLVCLTDATDRESDKIELWSILQQTLNDKSRSSRDQLSESSTSAVTMINSFETLLLLLLATKSIITLKCVVYFVAGAGDRLFDEKLKEYLRRYYRGVSSEHVLRSLDVIYRAFMHANTAEVERLDILRGFLLPSFEICDTTTIESFFERNILELYEIAEQPINNSDNSASVKRVIVSKIGYFQLMTIMFSRVDRNRIDDMNSSIVTGKKNKSFSQQVFHSTWSTRVLGITLPDCGELARRLRCAAYNCSLAIICLKEEKQFYKAAFSQGSDPIWENIVDCGKCYKLDQTFEKKPKNREITVNIKSTRDVQAYEYTYIHSYDLSACTLSEDINAYDFNRCDLLPSDSHRPVPSSSSANFSPSQSHSATNIILESDDFNEHECMPYIYVLLQRVKILFRPSDEEPEWLRFFFSACLPNHSNIQLFMLKIVWNTADVFKLHAKFALTPIVKVTVNYLEQHDLNYIVTDILETLIDWRDMVTPNENDKTEIQKLFEVVVDKALPKTFDKKKVQVHKYNLSLIKNMVEKWRDCLRVSNDVLMNKIMKVAPNAAVYLILILLQNDMTEAIVTTDDVVKFLLELLDKWEASESLSEMACLRSCECLGLCLKFLRNETGRENRRCELQQKILDILGAKKPSRDMIKQVKRIAHLCRTCPDVAVNYARIAISAMAKNMNKSYCLEIFFLAMPKIDTMNIVDDLHHVKLEKVLESPVCEKMALHIVCRMVTIVSPTVLLPYVKQTIRYIKDNTAEHRNLVYDILMSVHKKYSADIAANDATVQDLLSVSTRNLLAGLLDPCPDLQEKILKFWAEETELSTDSPKDRLIALLDMYSSQITTTPDDVFAPFVVLLMLQLTTKTRDYTKKMFEQPLHSSCTFENYKIPIFRYRQNLSSTTPMFVDSLASQINHSSLSQSSEIYATPICSRGSFGYPLRLRATQDLQFEWTLVDEGEPANATATFDIASLDTEFDRARKQPWQSTRRKTFRFLANSLDVARFNRNKQIQKNEQRAEVIKKENIRQQSSVRLYRDYRKGDFPDIQIPHKSLIVPLQKLIMLDRLICKDVTVSLLCALVEDIKETEKSDDFCQAVVEKLKRILQKSCERSSSFSAIILETLLKLRIVDCNPRDIMKISKINGLNTLGTLFLEQSLLPDTRDDNSVPPPSKQMRRQDDDMRNEETEKWAQLAFLYKSLNDVDVVLSIFREQQSFGQHVQEAALAEANGDWIRAKHAFEKGYKRAEKLSIKEHCMQGLLEAVNNLCDWSAIDKLVKSRVTRDLNNIWNDSWRDWMIPYICNAYTYMYGMGESWSSRDNDMKAIESWMNDRDKLTYLKCAIGENLVMNLLKSDEKQKVTDLLNDLLDKAAEQWVELNPLCAELGIRKLQKLQAISDLDASLKVLRCTDEMDRVARLADLLNFWSTKAPTIRDDLIQWNKLVAFRLFSSMLIEELINKEDDDNDNNDLERITLRMRRANIQLRLDVGDAALSQKHRYIAEKYLNRMTKMQGIRHLNMEVSLAWLEARTKCLRADLELDAKNKMTGYVGSWECSHNLLNKHVDSELYTAFKRHIGVMASKIESSSRENDGFASELMRNTVILSKIRTVESTNVDDLDTVRRELLRYSLNNLRMCCERAEATSAANVGEHYCALAKHCYGRLTTIDVESGEIFRVFLSSTLKSMRHGYLETMHYFPCLLRSEHLQYEQTRKIFDQECAMLQPWLFLRWRDLLFSHLGTSIADAVAPIVERLAETYPDAVIYTYYLAIEQNSDSSAILQRTQKLRSLLGSKAAEYERFLEAIRYVAQPELYLKYHLDETMKKLSRGEVTVIDSLLQRIHQTFGSQVANRNNPRSGKVYQGLADCVRKIQLLKINPDNLNDLGKEVQEIKRSLDKSLEKRLGKSVKRGVKAYSSQLKDYSPFLHEYTGGSIEIPGQYSGDKEPTPCYHVKIARFEPDVLIMPSLRKPIRINMIGDNGREYKFLVKFAEDLTIDRGLQQLYATMNRTLRNDASCGQRRLAIDTYEVIPLSRSFGLIQWIEGTKSLEDLVEFSLRSKDTENCVAIRKNYEFWIADAAPSTPQLARRYEEAISKYSQRTVTDKMKYLIGKTKQTALRDTFTAIGTSPECFVTLRRNFVTSYATMCVAHWLAGIGDRNLQNTLVHITTGRCLGIDFGYSFGSAIRAPIPELVPFRLTPQILELLRPFTERDLLATIMTHAMRALRDDRGPILACMDIFIHKPASRSLDNDDEITRESIDLTWSSKKNIEIVAKKLNGIHPSFITLEQLKETRNDKYFTRYQTIVTGNDEFKQIRADKRNDCLTPAEQVDCLLDQARDLNILGRMYARWQPWL